MPESEALRVVLSFPVSSTMNSLFISWFYPDSSAHLDEHSCPEDEVDDDELMLNVLRCQLTY